MYLGVVLLNKMSEIQQFWDKWTIFKENFEHTELQDKEYVVQNYCNRVKRSSLTSLEAHKRTDFKANVINE